MKDSFGNFRIVLFVISWFAAVSSILWSSDKNFLIDIGVITFSIFLILTLTHIKRQSIFIIIFLLAVYTITVKELPDLPDIIRAIKHILIFAGLIPTMGLVRATAQKLNNVKRSQELLSRLPNDSFGSGFQIAAHFFGSVINTGVFAMLAAAMPPNSNFQYRKLTAEAVLRGMSSSATWSPFFVAFVIGQAYLDVASAWVGLAIGLIIGPSFSIFSILLLNKKLTLKKLTVSLVCLQPMLSTLLTVMILVVGSALIFGFTALSAVIIIMPLLIFGYLVKKPAHLKPITIETFIYLKKNTDDVVVISFAMLIGYFITNSPEALALFKGLYELKIPSWSILIFIPITMTLFSLVGVHPVISSTVLLSTFTSLNIQLSEPLLMQAHLIGWCAGTMSSIASLSVITCSNLFQIPSSKLCYGVNSITTISFALTGGIVLALISQIVKV